MTGIGTGFIHKFRAAFFAILGLKKSLIVLLFWALLISLSLAYAEPVWEDGPPNLFPQSQGVSERRSPELPRISLPFETGSRAHTEAPENNKGPIDPVSVSVLPASREFSDGPYFALIPSRVRAGEPITVAYTDDFSQGGSANLQAVLLNNQGRRIARATFFNFSGAFEAGEMKIAVLAVPSTAGNGSFSVRIEAGTQFIQELPLTVDPRDFVSEVIALDEENTALLTVPDPQKTAEAERLWAILSRTGTVIYDNGPFISPVNSTRLTSFYGDRRVFRYIDGSTDTSIHGGIDFGVPTGTEVRSCAAGRVVFAEFRIVTGHSVIVEHLPGVFSLYYHLDSIDVEENVLVDTGTLLGYSGSTGLATGPHLHWEIRIAGENSDPDAFTARPILDKDEILRNLTRY